MACLPLRPLARAQGSRPNHNALKPAGQRPRLVDDRVDLNLGITGMRAPTGPPGAGLELMEPFPTCLESPKAIAGDCFSETWLLLGNILHLCVL